MDAGLELGPVSVHTTQNRGFTPEEVAQRCMDKIMYVSDQAPDAIRQQAHAYRNYLYEVIVRYMKEAIRSDRTTLIAEFTKQGHHDMAEIIRRL